MPNYLIIENNIVINMIIADSKEIAELATGLEVIESVSELPSIGYTRSNGSWIPPQPFQSWTFDGIGWNSPTERPIEEGKYFTWNEDLLNWDSHDTTTE
jgi:hypothetical protein